MPRGSFEAAASDATSVLRGVLGMIIDETRITMVVHERWPILSGVGTLTTVFRRAIAAALTSMYQRLKSVFRCCVQWEKRMYRNSPTDIATPQASMASVVVGTTTPTVAGRTT